MITEEGKECGLDAAANDTVLSLVDKRLVIVVVFAYLEEFFEHRRGEVGNSKLTVAPGRLVSQRPHWLKYHARDETYRRETTLLVLIIQCSRLLRERGFWIRLVAVESIDLQVPQEQEQSPQNSEPRTFVTLRRSRLP